MKYKIILAMFGFLLLSPASIHAQTVSGTNFELYGPGRQMTAQLTTSGEGTPSLFMFDKNRTVRVSIGLYPDGAPGVVLNDSTGKAAAIMRLVDSGGNPVLVLKENGQDKLMIDKSGVPALSSATSYLPTLLAGFVGGLLGGLVIMIALKPKVVV